MRGGRGHGEPCLASHMDAIALPTGAVGAPVSQDKGLLWDGSLDPFAVLVAGLVWESQELRCSCLARREGL
eukprot:493432-Rhodomonas_salina.1